MQESLGSPTRNTSLLFCGTLGSGRCPNCNVRQGKHNTNEPIGAEQLSQLFDRYAAPLELYARQLCGEPEDVVQDAIVELAGQSQTPDDVQAWLYRVVRNKAMNAARTTRRRRQRETQVARERSNWFCVSDSDQIDAQAASAALRQLRLQQREIVVAHLWGGLSFRQIGDLVGISSSAAHRRYIRAVEKLRKQLGLSCQTSENHKVPPISKTR